MAFGNTHKQRRAVILRGRARAEGRKGARTAEHVDCPYDRYSDLRKNWEEAFAEERRRLLFLEELRLQKMKGDL